jgi:hypothetical protein
VTQPTIGELIYLASYLIRVRVSALQTPPDTPNQYTADFHVMGDQGAMSLDALAGPPGTPGQQEFAFRQQDDANVNSSADLPTDLTNLPADIGKYWLIDTVNSEGVVTAETAWVWYGTGWRQFQLGLVGPPGPVPDIQIDEQLIPPGADAYVDTSNTSFEPSWELFLPEPAGPTGATRPLWTFPDVDSTTPPVAYDLLAFNGNYTTAGEPIWAPFSMKQLLPGPYSMPEGSFASYSGIAQLVNIGSITIPAQTFDWTPVCWGRLGGTTLTPITSTNAQHLLDVSALGGTFHLTFNGATTPAIPFDASPASIQSFLQALPTIGVGNVITSLQGDMNTLIEYVGSLAAQAVPTLISDATNLIPDIASAVINVIDSGGNMINQVFEMLSGDPLMIGARVVLADGTQVARGLGNTLGRVNIVPHYSTGASKTTAITPKNEYAMIPAGQAETLYVQLWNDGQLGVYDFNPTGAQLFVMASPVNLARGA